MTSAEERAKEIVEACRAYDGAGDLVFLACDRAEALIAQAIREAENDKLEEPARALEALDRGGDEIIETSPSSAAETVRSLKTKD